VVTSLATTGEDGAPHVIPVSAVHRAGDVVWLGLAARRTALANLRARPAAALLLLDRGVARTLHGPATVAGPLPGAERVVGVRLDVEREQDHLHPQMRVEAGVRWTWTSGAAARRDDAVLEGLRALAAAG
jgi:flavin reductase (DIM6/NTAB) family NADH-FMN oxidoreductase RutF